MDQPLKGIRVLDFTHLLPGELLSALLSDLGAEIVGYRIGQQGSLGGSIRFTYLRTEGAPGAIVELVELSDPVEASFVALHQLAAEWDGADPIRPLAMAR